MSKLIRGLALGAILALSLVATGAEAFAAEVNGADVAFVSGKPKPPAPTTPVQGPTFNTLGVTWED